MVDFYEHHLKKSKWSRRSVAMVWTMASLTTLIGFTALSVDVGFTLHTKSQLQTAADAAAMAAASKLVDMADGSEEVVFNAAQDYVTQNKVAGKSLVLDDSDVIFGKSIIDEDGKATFVEGQEPYDAVRVRVRMTDNSPNGGVPLFFGGALGCDSANLSAEATAVLVPRDIAIVIDMSRSMNYDSQLRHEPITDINIQQVWQGLGSHTYGNMTTFHTSRTAMPTYTTSTSAIKTTLGLNSVPYPYTNCGSWTDYINWVKDNGDSGSSPGIPGCEKIPNPDYRDRYGLRTFINYLLATKTTYFSALANAPAQPAHALKQAVEELDNFLLLLDSGDHLSLHAYATYAEKIVSLTGDFTLITQGAYRQWPGSKGETITNRGTETNISAGIDNAVAELTSTSARSSAKKVIFLMTDGYPTRPTNEQTGRQYTYASAENAADKGIQIYTISLGTDSDAGLMADLAEIGKGVHFHVPTLDISQYSEDLKEVFRTLGGKRPVRLIE